MNAHAERTRQVSVVLLSETAAHSSVNSAACTMQSNTVRQGSDIDAIVLY